MSKKKFSPRNKLLQYDLDSFLYWRFRRQKEQFFIKKVENSFEFRNRDFLTVQNQSVDTENMVFNRNSFFFSSKSKFKSKSSKLSSRLSKTSNTLLQKDNRALNFKTLKRKNPIFFNALSLVPARRAFLHSATGRSALGSLWNSSTREAKGEEGSRSARSKAEKSVCEPKEISGATFFPEKKNFMQFWTLPLLGASFLSFLTFDKVNSKVSQSPQNISLVKPLNIWNFSSQDSKMSTSSLNFMKRYSHSPSLANSNPEAVRPAYLLGHKALQKLPVEGSETEAGTGECLLEEKASSSNKKKGEKLPVEHGVQNTKIPYYISDYSLVSVTTKPISKYKSTKDIEDLCLFYLNLTEEKYNLGMLKQIENSAFSIKTDLENQKTSITQLSELEKKRVLNFLYLQNSFFHWNTCNLYSLNQDLYLLLKYHMLNPNLVFLTKLNPGFQLMDSNVAKEENLIKAWKKNPTVSYLKSAQFFENWLLKLLSLQNVEENMPNFSIRKKPSLVHCFNEKEAFFSDVAQQSRALKFFDKLLQTLTQSKTICIKAYQNFLMETKKDLNMERKIQKAFMRTFEKKYQSSICYNLLQKNFSNAFKQPFTNKRTVGALSKKVQFNKLLEKSVGLSILNKAFFLKTSNQLYQTNLQKELFFLKNLRTAHKKTFIESEINLIKKSNGLHVNLEELDLRSKKFQTNVSKKNSAKWMQEMKLYSQFNEIQKRVLKKLNTTKPNTQIYKTKDAQSDRQGQRYQPIKISTQLNPSFEDSSRQEVEASAVSEFILLKKAHIYFSNKQNNVSIFIYPEVGNMEISSTSTSSHNTKPMLNRPVVNSERNDRFTDKNPILHTFSKLKFSEKSLFSMQWGNIETFFETYAKFKNLQYFNQSLSSISTLEKKDSSKKEIKGKTPFYYLTKPSNPRLTVRPPLVKVGFYKKNYRKAEKIFRSYLSIKNAKGLQNKNERTFFLKLRPQNYREQQKIYLTLKQLKNNVLLSRSHFKLSNPKKFFSAGISKLYEQIPKGEGEEKITSTKAFSETKKTEYCSFLNTTSNKPSLYENKNKLELRNLQDFFFLKKANLAKAGEGLARLDGQVLMDEEIILEKKKNLEKKRRFKKLKLENRRRKKRKRFYPRPHTLRFQSYMNFLQKRHLSDKSNLKKHRYFKYFPKNYNNCFSQNLSSDKVSEILKSSSIYKEEVNLKAVKYTDFSKSIYGQNSDITDSFHFIKSFLHKKVYANKDSHFEFSKELNGYNTANITKNPNFLKNTECSMPHEKEFYKISNQTLTEFERLCWKSYWLRSNLKPYVLKIQKSLKRMKNVENLKTTFSNQYFATFSRPFDEALESHSLKEIPVYLNNNHTKNGILPLSKLNNEDLPVFKKEMPDRYLFEKLATRYKAFNSITGSAERDVEYQKLVYERLNDEIKNVKSQLTVDGQSQARSYKTGREKLVTNMVKPFWNTPFAFSNNYLEPNLNAVTSLINSHFIKTDFTKQDFPTLRLLWSCHKSQLFTYQPNNLAQNLWSSYKIREQTKNNKTRKFFYRLSRKITDFKDWLEVYKFENFHENSKKEKSGNLERKEENLNLLHKHKNKKLQNLSIFKTNWTNKKMQTFGGLIPGKNYSIYLQNAKLQLQEKPRSKKARSRFFANQMQREKMLGVFENIPQHLNLKSRKFEEIRFDQANRFENKAKVQNSGQITSSNITASTICGTNFQNPIQKRQFHFWWSLQKPSTPFMLGFLFSDTETNFLYTNILTSTSSLMNSRWHQEFILQSIWLGSCMLHVGIFFVLIRIPEIRSLVKFQVLLFSKLCNAYFIGIFNLYDLLKNYGIKIQSLSKQMLKVSNNKLESKRTYYKMQSSALRPSTGELLARSASRESQSFSRSLSFSRAKLRDREKCRDPVSQITNFTKNISTVFLYNKNSRNVLLNRETLKERKSNPTRAALLKWIQPTVHWNFYYKTFSKVNQNKKNQNVPNIEIDSIYKGLHMTALSSIYGDTSPSSYELGCAQIPKLLPIPEPSAGEAQGSGDISSASLFKRSEKEETQNNLSTYLGEYSLKAYQSWSTGFFWKVVLQNLEISKFLSQKKHFNNLFHMNISSSNTNLKQSSFEQLPGASLYSFAREATEAKSAKRPNSSYNLQSNIQMQSFLTLGILAGTRLCFSAFYICLNFFYKLIFQTIDVLEGTLLIFYKFLEKPAEVLVDWIAEVFLIEWSSEMHTYIPEAFDTTAWTSLTKYSRFTRFFYGLPFGFMAQRFFLELTQAFYQWLLQPDADLLARQKKGIIFWDIWSEILIQAAEKYKMNLSSLNTIKEEQELLIQNLLEQKPIEMITPSQTNNMWFDKAKPLINNEKGVFIFKKKQDFLNSEFSNSLTKLDPLMKFIQNKPHFYTIQENQYLNFSSFSFKNKKVSEKLLDTLPVGNLISTSGLTFPKISRRPLDFGVVEANEAKEARTGLLRAELRALRERSAQIISEQTIESFSEHFTHNSMKRWSVSQYLNTQGKDTDLFMDIHPPKSFAHVSFLKSYLPAQEILGSLVCEIYAGLFASKVSKNVLIVGAPGLAKTFFIQALAGETELKIVLDNAHRYAFVNSGVPVGMKLLREVFASIALHTPCLFLLEDVHVIGERRPMLISDDETSKTKDSAFGAEQEEVHEKNKLVYQLSKHALSHYKKPYKGDFSTAIPTNHFCYDLFLGVSPPRKRRSGLTAASPLPIQQLDKSLNSSLGISSGTLVSQSEEGAGKEREGNQDPSTGESNLGNKKNQEWVSALQISVGQVFAPPATSPFHVLLMKEQKKLKPKKLVKDIPWSGLSYDQWMLLSKNNYSVRVKVALLAEIAMKSFSVKLDMITDLLVIIDSVRSNRGFVVFATTHLPALLDPALRRPGRLDETISLPLLPNIETRFEIFKTRLSSYSQCMDFFDWSLYSSQTKQNENQLSNFLNKNILLLFSSKFPNNRNNSSFRIDSSNFQNSFLFVDYPISSLCQAFQSSLSLQSFWNNTDSFKKIVSIISKQPFALKEKAKQRDKETFFMTSDKLKNNYLTLSYAQTGQFLTEALLLKEQNTYAMKFISNLGFKEFSGVDNQKFMFQSLYGSTLETKQTLFKLFASKITEFFIFQMFSPALNSGKFNMNTLKFDKTKVEKKFKNQPNSQRSTVPVFNNLQNYLNSWQAATSFLDSMFQKRYLYNKNTIVSKMLFFEEKMSLVEPPSPPNSSILTPSRKFENYQRTFRDFIQKPGLTINEKLQMHQKQRFLKLLYNIPVKSFARTGNRNNFQTKWDTGNNFSETSSLTIFDAEPIPELRSGEAHSPKKDGTLGGENFNASFKELSYLDLITLRPSSTYAFYKNRFFQRQRFSFLNQWWNGQLAEHNAENTYLSHIDWRSIFVPSLGDVFLDFPDAEQYYNPRTRRWLLQSKSWSYWLNFEADMRNQVSEHFLVECFTQTSQLLHLNRELMDYLSYRFLRNHQLHEIDLLQVCIRFYKQEEISV